ncbi:MAG TPA: hypothetical protein VHZ78_10755 [Rhizomicrobium sp.]|jgi:hypothetical protein|nr:hypothetical protein [Rhizomicrobium sp.]
MKARKRSASGKFTIDGTELDWSLLREAQYTSSDGYKGMAFTVRAKSDPGSNRIFRELILEFPFPKRKYRFAHQEKERIEPRRVEAAIRLAMTAGWDPVSRGRVFAFQIEPEDML